jgi:hypothetical protein
MVSQWWANSPTPWVKADSLVAASHLSRSQVQVAIIDSVRIHSWNDGSLTGQVLGYERDLSKIIRTAQVHYPNLRLVYLLPFHYAGYINNQRTTLEPFAFQEGFGIQQFVDQRGAGSPVLLWGPYVWASTMNPSYYYDGVHFQPSGRAEMASLMWTFLQADPAAQKWLWTGGV